MLAVSVYTGTAHMAECVSNVLHNYLLEMLCVIDIPQEGTIEDVLPNTAFLVRPKTHVLYCILVLPP